ncbi:hypothetical protein V2J09_011690 [Rumex salicifolius]
MFRWRSNSNQNQDDDVPNRDLKINELKAAIGPLTGRSLQYCTDACLRRYLEARNWNVDKAKKMLEETLKWRSSFKPEEIRWNDVAVEGETGKVYRANFHDRWSITNNVPIKTTRETINILQNHYPERLAVAFLYSPPRIFETFWKVVKYFLDTKTFEKVKFVYQKNNESVELMKSCFDMENLPVEFGGEVKLDYDHEEFSKMMAQDDLKYAKFWGIKCDEKNKKMSRDHSCAEVAPEPAQINIVEANS